jgi:hypothetical protein
MLEKPHLDRLANAEEKLYSPGAKFDVRPRRPLQEKHVDAVKDWAHDSEGVSSDEYVASLRRSPSSPFAKVFLVAFTFFLLAAGYGFWKLGPGAPGIREGTEDIRLSVVAPSVAQGGDEFAFDVVIQNLSPMGIRLADLVVDMPPGTRDAETMRENLPRLRIPVGDIAAGETRRQTVAVALFGDEGERREFDIRLEYRAPNSSTIFEKERSYEVALVAAPILLAVDALSEITPGQPLTFGARVSSNAPAALGPIGLQVDLPFGFTVSELSEAPREDGLWVFERLEPGETREVLITGTLDGAHGDQRVFRFVAGALDSATSTEVSVPYGSRAVEVAVTRPFLDLILTLDDSVAPEVVRYSQNRIASRLAVVNNTTGPIRDVVVDMLLTGLSLDERTVDVSDGIYRSSDNVVHWDKTTNGALEEILPGETKLLSLGFQSKPLAERAQVFANPEVVMDIKAVGRRVFDENVPEELESKLLKRIKFLTNVRVASAVEHLSGPNPPKVDAPSAYRVTWELSNTSNDIQSGSAYAVLAPLLEWEGAVEGDLSFDPVTRRVTWRLGDIDGGAGYGRPARVATFDVVMVPSVLYEDQVVPMLGEINFIGNDTFAGAEVDVTEDDMTTTSIPGIDGKVQP